MDDHKDVTLAHIHARDADAWIPRSRQTIHDHATERNRKYFSVELRPREGGLGRSSTENGDGL